MSDKPSIKEKIDKHFEDFPMDSDGTNEPRVKLADGVYLVGAWADIAIRAEYTVNNKERIDRERAELLSRVVPYNVG